MVVQSYYLYSIAVDTAILIAGDMIYLSPVFCKESRREISGNKEPIVVQG